MSKMSFVTDMILDTFKRVLVRFKNAKFGLLFFINIFKIPDFLTDNRVNIFSKFKLIFSLLTAILYIISLEKKNKKEPTGEINPVTGKKIYKEVPDKFEFWLSKFVIKNDIEEDEDDF